MWWAGNFLSGNNVTFNIDTVDLSPGGTLGGAVIGINDGSGTVNLLAGRKITTASAGIYIASYSGNATANVDGTIVAGLDGINVDVSNGVAGGDVRIKATGDITSTARNGIWIWSDIGKVNVSSTANLSGGINGLVLTQFNTVGPTGTVDINLNKVTGTTGHGIWTLGYEGATNITSNGAVTAALNGIYSWTTSGALTINANSTVTGGVTGISSLTTTGAHTINVKSNVTGGVTGIDATVGSKAALMINGFGTGIVKGAAYGIRADSPVADSGNITIKDLVSVTATAGEGITTRLGTTGIATITNIGTVSGVTYGIRHFGPGSLVANNITSVTASGGEGITSVVGAANSATISNIGLVSGTTYGIRHYGPGALSVDNVGTIRGSSIDGVGAVTLNNNISVQRSGLVGGITGAEEGLQLWAYGGNINIGAIARNGLITGGLNGIDARTLGAGRIDITTNANVTGNAAWGIFADGQTASGPVNVTVEAATVQGATRGLEARNIAGTGSVNVNIAAPAIVQGGVIGLLIGGGIGASVATATNAGIVRQTGDTGAAGIAGGDANWAFAGNNIVNNTGQWIGRTSTIGALS